MKDAEFERERARMMDAVALLKDKQAEIERPAPPLRQAIAQAKDDIRVLTRSQERAQELTRRKQEDLPRGSSPSCESTRRRATFDRSST